MNADRKAEKAQYAEFNVPTCTGADAEASLLRTKLIYSVLPHMEMNTVCLEKLSNVHTGHQILPGLAQGSFQWKNLIEQLKLLLKLMLIERWRRPSMLSSMRQHVTRLQFDSCAKKHSLCGTVMIHDGLNLRCLDQCHCVRSHGKSSSQSWCNRIVIQQSESKSESIHERQHLL